MKSQQTLSDAAPQPPHAAAVLVGDQTVNDLSLLAYIDPGAGTILLQMVFGSLVGLVLYFRQGVARLLGLGRRDGVAGDKDAGQG